MPRDLIRPALDGLVAYEPGKPIEEVQRELGLERVVKLGSNEGYFGPFPQAVEAIERSLPELNNYPDGGAYLLVHALAEKHGVDPSLVAVAAGADGDHHVPDARHPRPGRRGRLRLAVLRHLPAGRDPDGRRPRARAAHRTIATTSSAMLGAITDRTKLVYLCNPNNPTGTMITRDGGRRLLRRRPRPRAHRPRRGVLRVRRRAPTTRTGSRST